MRYGISDKSFSNGRICLKCGNPNNGITNNEICPECIGSRRTIKELRLSKAIKTKRPRGRI